MPSLTLTNCQIYDPSSRAFREQVTMELPRPGIRLADQSVLETDVIDLNGSLILPDVCDLHTHVFEGTYNRPPADAAGVARGATTIIDGGSAGCNTFGAFRRSVEGSRSSVKAWLNLSSIGLIDGRVPELLMSPHIDPEGALACARDNADMVVGFKARLSRYAAGGNCVQIAKILVELGQEASLPVMIHIGDTREPLSRILPLLRPGDVVTHCFTPGRWNILEGTENVHPAVIEAHARGVKFDLGRGNHFSFPIAEKGIAAGVVPHSVSTDLSVSTIGDPTYGIWKVIEEMIRCGMEEIDALHGATVNPRSIVGMDTAISWPYASDGYPVEFTVLERIDEPLVLRDSRGESRQSAWRYEPRAVGVNGQYLAL